MRFKIGQKIIFAKPRMLSEDQYEGLEGIVTGISISEVFYEIKMADGKRHYVLEDQITKMEKIA